MCPCLSFTDKAITNLELDQQKKAFRIPTILLKNFFEKTVRSGAIGAQEKM